MMLVSTKQTLTSAVRRLSAPLPLSEVESRAQDMARERGLILQPAFYTLPFEVAARVARGEVTPSTEDGPLIVTRVWAPKQLTSVDGWQLAIETGTRRITTGRVFGQDAFYNQSAAIGDASALAAPILVGRLDTLSFEAQMPVGVNTTEGEGFTVYGYHVRGSQGERLPPGMPEAMCDLMAEEGTLWLIGLVSDTDDGAAVRVNAQRDCLLQRVVLAIDAAGEGEVEVDEVKLAIGNTDLFPQGLAGSVVRQVTQARGTPMVVDGARWPIMAGAVCTFTPRPENGVGDVADSRVLLVTRAPRT